MTRFFRTGEFREPKDGEWFEGKNGEPIKHYSDCFNCKIDIGPRWILRVEEKQQIKIPPCCPGCGSSRRKIHPPQASGRLWECLNCGHFWTLPEEEEVPAKEWEERRKRDEAGIEIERMIAERMHADIVSATVITGDGVKHKTENEKTPRGKIEPFEAIPIEGTLKQLERAAKKTIESIEFIESVRSLVSSMRAQEKIEDAKFGGEVGSALVEVEKRL